GFGKAPRPRPAVVVAADGMHRREGLQRLQNLRSSDVARMDDEVGTTQGGQRLWPNQPVRVGDNADDPRRFDRHGGPYIMDPSGGARNRQRTLITRGGLSPAHRSTRGRAPTALEVHGTEGGFDGRASLAHRKERRDRHPDPEPAGSNERPVATA